MAQTLWGIHAGKTGDAETLFLQHGHIALGWREMGGLGELPDDRKAFREKVAATYPDEPDGAIDNYTGQLYRFVHVMKVGDYIAFRPKATINKTSYVFLGRVAGPYVYNPFLDPNYPDMRRVEWLRSVPISRFSAGALHELGSAMSLFQIDTHATEFFAVIAESK